MVILAADITNFTFELFNKAYKLVPPYRRAKADKLRIADDKKRSIAAGIILNTAVRIYISETDKKIEKCQPEGQSKDIGINSIAGKINYIDMVKAIERYNPEYDYDIGILKNGKPYFINHPDICYNIAHSGKYVVCVVSDSIAGIDIEGCRNIKSEIKLAKRFFSSDECGWLGIDESIKLDEKEFQMRFLRLWTLKEAYAKVTGEGIARVMARARFICADNRLQFDDNNLKLKYMFEEYELKNYDMRMAVMLQRH